MDTPVHTALTLEQYKERLNTDYPGRSFSMILDGIVRAHRGEQTVYTARDLQQQVESLQLLALFQIQHGLLVMHRAPYILVEATWVYHAKGNRYVFVDDEERWRAQGNKVHPQDSTQPISLDDIYAEFRSTSTLDALVAQYRTAVENHEDL